MTRRTKADAARAVKRAGVVIGALGAAGMILTADEPAVEENLIRIGTDGSLIWFAGACVAFALGIAIYAIPEAVRSFREWRRFRAKMRRRHISAPVGGRDL